MDMKKKHYESPRYEVVRFDASDVINTLSSCDYIITFQGGIGNLCTGEPWKDYYNDKAPI